MQYIDITPAVLEELARARPRHRKQMIKLLGESEFARIADDPIYWMHPGKHLIPYVYTLDPHPLYTCNLCNTTATHHFNKRSIHLEVQHDIKAETEGELRGYFTELSTVRPFPADLMEAYMEPIIRAWLREQFVFIEKSRDMMATWLVVTLYTWDTLYHPGRQNIFQSEDGMKTLELVKRAHFIYKSQPAFLRNIHKANFATGSSRAGSLVLPTLNSEILGFPQGADQIRQFHPSGFMSDESAFQVNAGDSFAAIKPSIQNGGRYTAVSSANPSWFYLAVSDRDNESGY